MSTIITKKQFNNHIYKTEIAGRPFSLEFGKVAELANASAMVTYAARDSDFDGHAIKAGEHLALLDGALLGSYPDVDTLMADMVEAFGKLEPEFITVYYGADVVEEDAARAAELITRRFPGTDISIVNGGQPVYYYMISVE